MRLNIGVTQSCILSHLLINADAEEIILQTLESEIAGIK